MIFNMSGGSSGGGLNFAVVGGLTQPASPKENTIWVKTETKITSWSFAPTEPESPNEGMVWFKTALTSVVGFNALKKNEIEVSPITAMQYANADWISITAQTYTGTEWVEWLPDGALYYKGNENVAVTGGWTVNGYAVKEDGSTRTVKLGEKKPEYMQTNYASGYVFYMFGTDYAIDLTNVNQIEIDAERVSGSELYLVASATKTITLRTTKPYLTIDKDGISRLDVSAVNSAYIAIIPRAISATPPIWKIHSVRCVK